MGFISKITSGCAIMFSFIKLRFPMNVLKYTLTPELLNSCWSIVIIARILYCQLFPPSLIINFNCNRIFHNDFNTFIVFLTRFQN